MTRIEIFLFCISIRFSKRFTLSPQSYGSSNHSFSNAKSRTANCDNLNEIILFCRFNTKNSFTEAKTNVRLALACNDYNLIKFRAYHYVFMCFLFHFAFSHFLSFLHDKWICFWKHMNKAFRFFFRWYQIDSIFLLFSQQICISIIFSPRSLDDFYVHANFYNQYMINNNALAYSAWINQFLQHDKEGIGEENSFSRTSKMFSWRLMS